MKLNINQMELEIAAQNRNRACRNAPTRDNRARWWFEQMRRAVERAPDPEEVYRLPQPDDIHNAKAA